MLLNKNNKQGLAAAHVSASPNSSAVVVAAEQLAPVIFFSYISIQPQPSNG